MIGIRIRQVRGERGLTQQAVAAALGVSRSAVAQWESGSSKGLKPENLLRLCRLLEVQPEWLVFGEGPRLAREPERADGEALASIVTGIERVLSEVGLVLPPDAKGELIALLYGALLTYGELPTPSAIRKRLRDAA